MLILYFCSIIAVITAANAGPVAESPQDEHSKMVEDLNKLKEIIKERVTNYKASHGKEKQSDALQRISNLAKEESLQDEMLAEIEMPKDSQLEEHLGKMKKLIDEDISDYFNSNDMEPGLDENKINKILGKVITHLRPDMKQNQEVPGLQQDSTTPLLVSLSRFSHPSKAEVIGTGFFLPEKDIKNGIFTSGKSIFKSIPVQCVATERLAISDENSHFYEDTGSFMTSFSTSTGISASYRSTFFLGVTVDVTTNSVDKSNRQIKGSSLAIKSLNKQDFLKDDCIDSLELDSSFVNDFKSLRATISDPSQQSSWFQYNNFIKRYGTHLIKVVRYGSSLTQETYSKKTNNYSQRDFKIRACADISGSAGPGKYEVGVCSGVSSSEEKGSQTFSMNSHLVVKGGSTETRSALIKKRSASLVEAFLNAGKSSNSPVEYQFHAIAELLLNRFARTTYVAQALNLRSFVEGFLGFGCALPRNDNPQRLRLFSLASSDPKLPEYQCSIPAVGCNSNNDCHYNWGRVVCDEYGSTAIAHGKETLPNGEVKPYAYTRGNSGVNTHCWYNGLFGCYCASHDKTRKVIWESGIITAKAKKMRALLDQ